MSLDEERSQSQPGCADERRLWLALVEQAARVGQLQAELSATRASLSWRLTAPLRALRAASSRRVDASLGLQPEETLALTTSSGDALPAWLDGLRVHPGDGRVDWLVDVTELAREDLGAGVERVTRRLLSELLLAPPPGVRVQPVRLTSDSGYVHANGFLSRFLGLRPHAFGGDQRVDAKCGDSFIGLDFCRNHASRLRKALAGLRASGVSINLLVHDVLPLTHPAWFPPGVPQAFDEWLRVLVEQGHRALCNSVTTAQELDAVLVARGIRPPGLALDVISLGADLPPAPFATVLPSKPEGLTRVLTVGTLEPRKGHAQTLRAFESLWQGGHSFQWIIAGKAGWNVESLVARIREHPEFGNRLLWVEGPDDMQLAALYRECDVLLAPSLGEGFGLPVAEAGWHGMPLIVRDLPVFREITDGSARYFSGEAPGDIAEALLAWCDGASIDSQPGVHWATWAESAAGLKEICARGQGQGSGVGSTA